MNKNTLTHEWEQYAERVIPDDAGPVQINETKLAFYAGALIVQTMTVKIVEDIDDEDAATQRVTNLYEECMNEIEKIITKKQRGHNL